MERKWAYLALPLLLAALLLGVKWRAEHPTPTKEDLAIRSLLINPRSAYVWFDVPGHSTGFYLREGLSNKHLKSFANHFYALPQQRPRAPLIGKRGSVHFIWYFNNPNQNAVKRIQMAFNISEAGNKCLINYRSKEAEYKIHPVTTKRWTELLLNHPRIGPELRARMK